MTQTLTGTPPKMFVSDYITVDLPVAEAQRRLLEEAGSRLSTLALAADDEAAELRTRIGPEVFGRQLVGKAVRLELGAARERGDRQVLSLRWEGTGAAGAVFPALDADLELAPLGPGATQISLNGRYQPPLQLVGRSMDRLLLHRVAQASIRAFLRRLGDALVAGHDMTSLERLAAP